MRIAFVDLNEPIKVFGHRFIINLALLSLYSLTPSTYSRLIVDDKEIYDCDVVCISVITPNSSKAYRLADKYREHGSKVILGGAHINLNPEEAEKHADSVVIGYAEEIFGKILKDIEDNKLKRRYLGPLKNKLVSIPIDRSKMFYRGMYVNMIELTRGCPNNCDFCSQRAMTKGQFSYKDIEEVYRELQPITKHKVLGFLKFPFFWIVDDNPFHNREYAIELFERIKSLNLRWFSYMTVDQALDEELLKKAYQAGCRLVFIGFESVNQESLKIMNKKNTVNRYKEAIRKVQNNHIICIGSLLLGADSDDKTTISATEIFLHESKLDIPLVMLLTPFPGTRLYERLCKEDRIMKPQGQSNQYSFDRLNFVPKNFSPDELIYEYRRINRKNSRFANKFQTSLRILLREKFNIRYLILYHLLTRVDETTRHQYGL